MSRFVLDASVSLAWCLDAAQSERARPVLEALSTGQAAVPHLWAMEVANALVVSERRGRITQTAVESFVQMLSGLPIEVDVEGVQRALREVLALARTHKLSAYDAAYLELALRLRLPIASQDAALRSAAERAGVALFDPA